MEMDAILAQLRGITAQLALAVELVLALLVIAGALVMVASVQAGLDARFRAGLTEFFERAHAARLLGPVTPRFYGG